MDQSTIPPRKRRSWPWVLLLAAIAFVLFSIWPESYVVRSQVSEGASLAESFMTAVAQYRAQWHAMPADNRRAGMPPPGSITGTYVTSVAIVNGDVVVTYGGKADRRVAGRRLVFSPQPRGDALEWRCDTTSGTTIEPKDRPTRCR